MTLNAYLSQTDPKYMPCVKLEPHEYIVKTSYTAYTKRSGSQKVTTKQIFIHAFPGVEYIQEGSWPQLYTTDKHGNPKAPSCFRI